MSALVAERLATEATDEVGASEPGDADLVARARDGDRAAMGALFERYQSVVHGVLLASGSRTDVDDVVQDVFVVAMRKIGSLRDGEAFCAWLLTIARRKAVDAARRRRRWLVLRESHGAAREDGRADEILAVIRSLPEAYRETLVWRLVEGLSGPQIAARTGMTPGSVRVNLHRGMEMLRQALEDDA